MIFDAYIWKLISNRMMWCGQSHTENLNRETRKKNNNKLLISNVQTIEDLQIGNEKLKANNNNIEKKSSYLSLFIYLFVCRVVCRIGCIPTKAMKRQLPEFATI